MKALNKGKSLLRGQKILNNYISLSLKFVIYSNFSCSRIALTIIFYVQCFFIIRYVCLNMQFLKLIANDTTDIKRDTRHIIDK